MANYLREMWTVYTYISFNNTNLKVKSKLKLKEFLYLLKHCVVSLATR